MNTRRLVLLAPDAPAAVDRGPAPTPATKPAASPAAPSEPAKTSTPAPATTGNDGFSDAEMADFDKQFGSFGPKEDEPKATPVPNTLADKKDAPAAKPEPAAPAVEDDEKFITSASPKQLREWAKKQSTEAKTAKAAVTAAETRIKEMEKRITDAEAKGKDTTALSERLATLEKQLTEREADLRMAKNEASPEFKKQFDVPFQNAARDGKIEVDQLIIENEDGTTRKASWEKDFAPLYALEYGAANKLARDKFGDDAAVVMEHYRTLHRLDRQRQEAFEVERQEWPKREQERIATEAKQREASTAMFSKADELIAAKPDFQVPVDDTEGQTHLKRGMDEFNIGMNESNFKTPSQKAVWMATMKHRAAHYHRLKSQLAAKDATIAELQAKVDGFTESKPGTTRREAGGTKPEGGEGGIWEGLDERKMMEG